MKKSIDTFIEGEHYIGLGLLTLAREKFLEALEINKKQQDDEGIGVCLIYLAQIEIKEKKKNTAQEYLNQAKAHYKNRNMEKMLAPIGLLQTMVDAIEQKPEAPVLPTAKIPEPPAPCDPFQLFSDGEIEHAALIFSKDVAEFRHSGNQRKLALALVYLGQCHFTLGQLAEARTALNEARNIARQIRDAEIIQEINQVFENIHLIEQQKELDNLSVQEICGQKLSPAEILILLLSKAEILILKGLGNAAEIAIHEARKLLPKQNLEKQLVLIMIVESKLLRLKGKIKPAKSLLQQAREIALKTREPELVQLVEKSDFQD
jgi:tetratricopeptide (TPR) repeat protein